MRVTIFLIAILTSHFLWAVNVNRLNGSASITYIDFSIPGVLIPLELVRTYNSITATNEHTGWSGAFGWGWTTPFETTMTTTPERTVLLRDGMSGNTIVFRPKTDDPAAKQKFFQEVKRTYFSQKLGRELSDKELGKVSLPEKMQERLKSDSQYRTEVAERYQVKSVVPQPDMLVSSEYGYQTLQFKDNQWVRERDGVKQVFDGSGRLVRQIDKNGAYFDFIYSKGNKATLSEIVDRDRSMGLRLTWRNDRVIEIVDYRGKKAKYTYDASGNLSSAIDSNNQAYLFSYDNKKFPHLITRIDYPNENTGNKKIYREITYDDVGLATRHLDKDGTEYLFTYGKSTTDPENNFWTRSTTKRVGQASVVETQTDEFVIKLRSDGTRYLYKQDTKIGTSTVTTIYTACCGKPLQTIKNGEVVNYKYYDNGLLKEKIGPHDEVVVEYHPRWKKVSKIKLAGVVSSYEYDARGNLVSATNSRSQGMTLKYDKAGRITEMVERSGGHIRFQYDKFGKPTRISEVGGGSIRIDYDDLGKIIKTAVHWEKNPRSITQAKGQEMVKRVLSKFHNLLDILRPASQTIN